MRFMSLFSRFPLHTHPSNRGLVSVILNFGSRSFQGQHLPQWFSSKASHVSVCKSPGKGGEYITASADEVEFFNRYSQVDWWSPEHPFYSLLRYNRLRIPFIREAAQTAFQRPLTACRILDVGCGGGFLSEALAEQGAQEVVGLDASSAGLEVAIRHKERALTAEQRERQRLGKAPVKNGLSGLSRLRYIEGDVSTLLKDYKTDGDASKMKRGDFDIIVASEVIEHVPNLELFLDHACKLLKPSGVMVLTAPNRTWLSYVTHIIGAEIIWKLLPKGTHHWSQFVTPDELEKSCTTRGLKPIKYQGAFYVPWPFNSWIREPFGLVSYMMAFQKVQHDN